MPIPRTRLPKTGTGTVSPNLPGRKVPGVISDPTNNQPKEPNIVTISQGAGGLGIPMVYGYMKIPGILMNTPANVGGSMLLVFALSLGPTYRFIDSQISGKQVPDGVSTTFYYGTQNYVPYGCALAYGANYKQHHTGITLVEVTVSGTSDLFGGMVELSVIGEWRSDIWDPRINSRRYTTNPALHAAHIMECAELGNMASYIDWTSVAAAANWCDTVVSGEARRYSGIYIPERILVQDAVKRVCDQARLIEKWSGGKWGLTYYDQSKSSVVTIDDTWVVQQEHPAEYTTNTDEQATRVRAKYIEPSRDWDECEQTMELAGVKTGSIPIRESDIQLPGVTSPGVAARIAGDVLNECQAYRRINADLKRKAILLEKGDNVLLHNLTTKGSDVYMREDFDTGTYSGLTVVDGKLQLA